MVQVYLYRIRLCEIDRHLILRIIHAHSRIDCDCRTHTHRGIHDAGLSYPAVNWGC